MLELDLVTFCQKLFWKSSFGQQGWADVSKRHSPVKITYTLKHISLNLFNWEPWCVAVCMDYVLWCLRWSGNRMRWKMRECSSSLAKQACKRCINQPGRNDGPGRKPKLTSYLVTEFWDGPGSGQRATVWVCMWQKDRACTIKKVPHRKRKVKACEGPV